MDTTLKKAAAGQDVVSPIDSETARTQLFHSVEGPEETNIDTASIEILQRQQTYTTHEHPESDFASVRSLDDYPPKDVESRNGNVRPVLRATSLILCAVILATNITEYSVVYTGSWDSYFFGGPDFLTGAPVAFVTFVWELTDFITTWSRGRGIHPKAHIIIELILGLAAFVSAFFTGWSLYQSVHWYRQWKNVVTIGPESVQVAMLALLVVICLSLHGYAIRDNKARKKAVDFKLKTLNA